MELIGGLLLPLSVVFAGTAVLVLARHPARPRHILAFMFGMSVAGWSLALYLAFIAATDPEAVFWARMAFVGPIAAVVTYLALLRDFEGSGTRKLLHWSTITASIFGVGLAILAFHPEVVASAARKSTGMAFEYGRYYGLQMAACGLLGLLGLGRAWYVCLRLTGRERAQAEIVLVGMVISGSLAALSNVVLPLLGLSGVYVLGPFAFTFGTGAFYYAMAKHRLYDIELGLGPLLKTQRFWMHEKVKEALGNPQNYLDLAGFSKALQAAFAVPDIGIKLLSERGRASRMYGNRDMPTPSPELLAFSKGKIVVPDLLPDPHRLEMREKGYSALVRLGDSDKPFGVLLLGKSLDHVLFSTQDFRLLGALARQLEIAVKVTLEFRTLVGKSEKEWDTRIGEEPLLPWTAASSPMTLLCLDPGGRIRAGLGERIARDFVVQYAESEWEFLQKALASKSYDLALVVARNEEDRVWPLMDDLKDQKSELPIVVVHSSREFGNADRTQWMEEPRVLGVCELGMTPNETAKVLRIAAASGRYFRGEMDPAVTDRLPNAAVKLFPLLVRAVSDGKDFMGMTRLFQRRLLEMVLSGSKTQSEAAGKLGLSAANLSLKLEKMGMREKRTPRERVEEPGE